MKADYKDRVDAFLKSKTIAVAGYSTDDRQPANHIFKRFADGGYNVFAVNPKADVIRDVRCYASLKEVPADIDAVVICTHPDITPDVVNECIARNVKHIWMHRSLDRGSYNEMAAELSTRKNINCITTGCPLMFLNADVAHKCIRWIMDFTGKLKN